MPILEIRNLTKSYGRARGVEDVSLTVAEGEILGFIGPNGSGKSTTIRCVMNLLNKNSGEILFEGKPLRKNDKEAYTKIGYLPSEINIYGDLTVTQMFRYDASFYGVGTLEKAFELAEKLQLETSKKISELSFGNSKKVGIVLALMHSPKLVVIDEATSGLDPLVQDEVYGIIRKEKAKGTSFLFSSHNLTEVKKLCDTVAIIREGKIVRVSPINELLATDVLKVKVATNDDLGNDFRIVSHENGIYTLICEKDVNELVTFLGKYRLKKLTIEEPELEEIFMHYYK